MTEASRFDPVAEAKDLLRRVRAGTLATLDSAGAPHASLVTTATLVDGSPVLLLSRLAAHTGHLAADARCSLLLADTGRGDPLAHPRLSLSARAYPITETGSFAEARSRFLRRHPKAALYADFTDFGFWRLAGAEAPLVAGFGRVARLNGADLLVEPGPVAAAEARAVDHMNADHRDALALYAEALAGCAPGEWTCSGLDPEGVDLICGDRTARVAFEAPICTAGALRTALVRLADQARVKS